MKGRRTVMKSGPRTAMNSGPHLLQLEKALARNEDPTQPKINKSINKVAIKKKKKKGMGQKPKKKLGHISSSPNHPQTLLRLRIYIYYLYLG